MHDPSSVLFTAQASRRSSTLFPYTTLFRSDERFDHIVIGAGSAGCVLTRRLLDAGKKVCLVESGEDETNPNIDHLNNLGLIWHSPQDWNHYTVPQPGTMDRRLHLPRGKVLGGSNALNAVI